MLGTRDAPLRIGNAEPNPERDRETAEIIDALHPVLSLLLQRHSRIAVAQALGSYLMTMLVRGVGPEKAAELFTGMANAAPTAALADQARHAGSRA